APAGGVGGFRGEAPGEPSADEARRGGGSLRDSGGGAVDPRRVAGRRHPRDPLRHRGPAAAQCPGHGRSRGHGAGPRRVSGGALAARPIVHVAFQVMVACGVVMLLFVLWGATLWWRRRRAASWVD